jgi:hypothetical protein
MVISSPSTITEPANSNNDPALVAAWRRFVDYDDAARRLRVSERRLRWMIIISALSTALLAILRIYLVERNPYSDLWLQTDLLPIILLVLSLITFGLIIYGAVYSRTNARLEFLAYRLCSNLIQHEIYLYRMDAGRYFEANIKEAQRLLKQSIDAAEKRVTAMGARPAPKTFDDNQMFTRLSQLMSRMKRGEDGFTKMSVDIYIEQRVKSLITFYAARQQLEAITLGRQYWLIGIVLGIGVLGIIVHFELLFLAALFIVIALNMFIEQGSYGITQLLNLPAATQLQSELDSWYMMPERYDPEVVSRLVQRLENIIQFESEMWVLYSLFRSSSVNQQTVITDIMQNGLSLLSSNNQQISPVRYARNSIFISYRRSDSADIVGRIYDRLSAYFGKETIFRDVQTINAGEDFQRRILSAVDECHVMLAIIGADWITIVDNETQQPRLHDPEDYVRREIAAALDDSNMVVVPVLVRGARMPDEDELPEDLRQLHYRNALQVRNDPDFEEDLKRLINAIELTVRVP